MLTRLRLSLFSISVFGFSQAILCAQESAVVQKVQLAGADQQWNGLATLAQPVANADLLTGKSGADLVAAQGKAAADSMAKADLLRKFYSDNPQSPKVAEAKRLEALNLVYAVQAGDNAHEGRWQGLVAELRDNTALPIKDRFAIAAIADHLAISRQAGLTYAQRLSAYEMSAQGLIAEFPTEPGGYEALLGVARNSSSAKAAALAQQLVGMPAPAAVKLQAKILADRFALVGKDLSSLLQDAGSSTLPEKGAPTVIYAWATWSPGSFELANRIKAKAGSAKIIGVCLDSDLTAAKATAASKAIPGELIYDDRGLSGAAVQALKMTDAGWVYVADRTGKIRSVRAQEDLSQLDTL